MFIKFDIVRNINSHPQNIPRVFQIVTFGDEQTVHLTLSRELMTICLLNSHPHPYPYPRFSNASMIRQELVPKDLIQKGERHKTIVQKSPYHEGESITNFQSNALKKSKTEKLEDQIP